MMKKLFYLTILALMPMMFTACSNDDLGGDSIPSDLLGTWYCDDGSLHLYFTFYADGTGIGAADGKATTRKYAFSYGVKGKKITCKGAATYAEYDGEKYTENNNWSTTFTLNGSTLTGGPYSGSRSTYRK